MKALIEVNVSKSPLDSQGSGCTMNVWSVAALGIGSMVGAGIFALLGQVALCAGHETYLAFVIGGIVAVFSGYAAAG